MTNLSDLEAQVLRYIADARKEDGGIYLTRIIGHFIGVEPWEVETALAKLHHGRLVRIVGREKTLQRVFLNA
ncbi:hypothetical protein [Streptomyces termitum]|uniref:hypothetical protein n=1 Tax=Streptomyces termitum TaxID=67368 RepID=UPI0033B4579B